MPRTTAGIIKGESRKADSAVRPGKLCRAMAKAAGREMASATVALTDARRRLTHNEFTKSLLRRSSPYHCSESPSQGSAR